MNPYVQLFRIGNCIMGVVGLILGAFIAEGFLIVEHATELLLTSIVVFTFVAGGNSLNDYTDREVDKRAHPKRPIPSGRISPRSALTISAVMFTISFIFSLPLDWISILIVVSAIAVMILYETWSKRAGLAGNLSISWLTGALFLLGGSVVGSPEKTVIFASMAFLATFGREIVKDIEDMEADFDRRTLPKRIGKKWAGVLGSLAFLVAVVLSFEPFISGYLSTGYLMFVVIADAIFIYCSIVHFRNPTKGQTWAKYGMLVALFAFLIGKLHVIFTEGFA
ncbi:MAG TPA: UbiA family prenyltransferase [Methanomassiliicoccales archaeon]|nr:UbiA family prenyltransferase [Methanomassiliicoccales archaeon]